nr:uridine diphosphate glucose pyrophosphatase NUDT14 isoform X1 [Equus asinus]
MPRAGHAPARTSPAPTLPASAPGPACPARRHGTHRGGGRGPLRSLALPAAAHAALPPAPVTLSVSGAQIHVPFMTWTESQGWGWKLARASGLTQWLKAAPSAQPVPGVTWALPGVPLPAFALVFGLTPGERQAALDLPAQPGPPPPPLPATAPGCCGPRPWAGLPGRGWCSGSAGLLSSQSTSTQTGSSLGAP